MPPARPSIGHGRSKPGGAIGHWPALLMTAALALATARAQDELPFVTSPEPVTVAMLRVARVQPSDVVLDLGSGDGRIVIAAARQFGARGLGVELSPDLVQRSRNNAARAGVAERTQFVVQDLFDTDLSVASVITMVSVARGEPCNCARSCWRCNPAHASSRTTGTWDSGSTDRTIVVDAPDKAVGRTADSGARLALHDSQLKAEAASGGWSSLRGVVFSRGTEGCR